MENEHEKPLGSNLTGTAVPAKPGHDRDIKPEAYVPETDPEESNPDKAQNTDALLGDVSHDDTEELTD
ncbi:MULTISPECIES: hypothetical protein [Pedobacter]|uniref:hypothetical protein n=1 Tax=Pedobacter TaxID=84567 RepID=UPI00210A32C2|nr:MULTISPECIES: hypothetical protein [unclassified Pedobacter]